MRVLRGAPPSSHRRCRRAWRHPARRLRRRGRHLADAEHRGRHGRDHLELPGRSRLPSQGRLEEGQRHLRELGLRGLSHACRRAFHRHRRAESRPAQTRLPGRHRAGDERRRRDAGVQVEAQPEADRGRVRLRRRLDRRHGAVELPPAFPAHVAAFALDLDRTLIAEDGVLRPRTRDALARTRSTGAHVVVVTGRMFRAVRPYLEQAQLDDLVVCYQGAVVADPATGEFLLHVPIPLAEAREAMDAVLAAGFHLNCYVDDLLYVDEVPPEARRYADFQHLEIHAVGDLRAWLDHDPTKLVAVGDPGALDELEAELKPRFEGRLFISKSLPYFLEFAHPDVSKGSGLAFVADRLGFAPEETVAGGDGENDRELLDWAGFGVAVANAHPDVLARADLLAPPVQEEGVAVLLEAYLDSLS